MQPCLCVHRRAARKASIMCRSLSLASLQETPKYRTQASSPRPAAPPPRVSRPDKLEKMEKNAKPTTFEVSQDSVLRPQFVNKMWEHRLSDKQPLIPMSSIIKSSSDLRSYVTYKTLDRLHEPLRTWGIDVVKSNKAHLCRLTPPEKVA